MKTAGALRLFACAILLLSLIGSGSVVRSEDYYDGDEPEQNAAASVSRRPAARPKKKTVRVYTAPETLKVVLSQEETVAAQEDVVPPVPDYKHEPAELAPSTSGSKTVAGPDSDASQGVWDDCGADCDLSCCLCGPPGQFWLRDEYVAWSTTGMRIPALITTSPVGTPPGVLGEPGTTVLFGDSTVNDEYRSGNRVTAGLWLDCCHNVALQFDYLSLGQADDGFLALGSRYPILARPFYNPVTGDDSSELVNVPGIVAGNAWAHASSEFQGGGLALRHNWCCENFCCEDSCCNDPRCASAWSQDCRRIDLIAGYRFYRLDDNVIIRESLVSTNPGGVIPQGTTFEIFDSFSSKNEFHGADLGVEMSYYKNRWSLDLLGKVAIGNNQRTVTITGQTVTTVPNQPSITYEGGLLALPTNIGTYTSNEFAAIPQLEARLGYQLTCHLRAYAGYSAVYWGSVARAGDQIDLTVNPSQLPPGALVGPARPAFSFNDSNLWAHGVNVGLEMRF